MKRFISIALLLMIVLLCACGKSSSVKEDMAQPDLANSIIESDTEVENSEPAEIPEPTPGPVLEERKGDFRSAYWGDDRETVKKYETLELLEDNDLGLTFKNAKVGAQNAYAIYYFDENGELYEGLYVLTDEHKQEATYISVYNSLKEALTSVYGKPAKDEIVTLSSAGLVADDVTALKYGLVTYRAIWENEKTTITLLMSTDDNDKINTFLNYQDKNYEEAVNTDGL